MPNRYFDLHFHPTLKTLFKEQQSAPSAWTELHPPDALLGNCLESQACLTQVANCVGFNLLSFSWHPPEMGMVDQWLLRLASRVYTSVLGRSRLKDLAKGTADYNQVMKEEWHNLISKPGIRQIKVLSTLDEYTNDDKKFSIVVNIEGGHTFYRSSNSTENMDRQYLENRLTELKAGKVITYLTPAHLTNNIFINHAYGNKILSKKHFIPTGYGISEQGKELIDVAYCQNVLVDVKHMSLIARRQFYDIHRKKYSNKPIIASHVGLTGISWNRIETFDHWEGTGFVRVTQKKKGGLLSGTYHNPNSVNLYREDVVEILKSGGLIGISLDLRILGAQRNFFGALTYHDKEFVSIAEFREWSNSALNAVNLKENWEKYSLNESEEEIWSKEDLDDQADEIRELFPSKDQVYGDHIPELETVLNVQFKDRSDEHVRYFINHVLTIVKICQEENLDINPWEHVCIGSDFDGLISAIHCCRNATQFPAFAQLVEKFLPAEAAKAQITVPPNVIDNLFFDNGYNFLKKHFS
ncbi:MAG: membrane dipeptidase [Bacteroidetes bacterium]|nr:membrane dipeptidase [Bacteroidota bacterium]